MRRTFALRMPSPHECIVCRAALLAAARDAVPLLLSD